ncbi:L-rhamnose mutarotase [compost metagenome]
MFAVLKLRPDNKIAELPQKEVMRRWWDYMADLMEVEPGNRPREWPLEQMFHFA